MILRSISRHVRDQNWFAVLLDFVIVVVGVFIGIQVANWNEERGDRMRESAYLDQLIDDLSADFREMDRVEGAARTRMAVVSMVLERASLPPPPETFYLEHCVYDPCEGEIRFEAETTLESDLPTAANDALTNLPQFNTVEHTYSALISTGDIGLLRDVNLRRRIQAYYATAAEVGNLDRTVQEQFLEMNNTRHELGLAAAGTDLDQLVEAVKASTKFAAQLRSHWAYSAFQARSIEHVRRLAEGLIDEIGGGGG